MENLRTTWKIAEQTSLQTLMDACLNFMDKNSASLISTPLVNKLKWPVFVSLLRRSAAVTGRGEQMFRAIASWVEFDQSGNRFEHLNNMLSTISKTQLNYDFILDQLASDLDFTNHPITK